jgi:hypothetical protein
MSPILEQATVSGGDPYVDVKAYGAVGNTQSVTNGVITSGSAALSSASNPFVACDVGKSIVVVGAGTALATLSPRFNLSRTAVM